MARGEITALRLCGAVMDLFFDLGLDLLFYYIVLECLFEKQRDLSVRVPL